MQETPLKKKHGNLIINSVMIHCISIFSGFLGIIFTILEYKAIICIIFDSISVASAIFVVITERKQKKKLENKKNVIFTSIADSKDLINNPNKILTKE